MSPETSYLTDSFKWLGPSFVLILAGCVILSGSLFTKREVPREITDRRNGYAAITFALLMIAFVWQWLRTAPESNLIFKVFLWDSTAIASERLAVIGGLILALIGWSAAPRAYLAEFFGCLAIIVGAVSLVGACNDLMALFLILELVSIPTYVMLGTVRGSNDSLEATVKYFMLSAFSSAFFLFGCSYLYGVAGTTDLSIVMEKASGNQENLILLIGMFFILCGLTFRITAIPFQFYGPDVFQGTTVSMAAMMSYIPKVTGFVVFVRLLSALSPDSYVAGKLIPLIIVLAVITMTVGNTMAAAQSNLRRLLGYSSVAHSGYILLGVAALMLGSADTRVIFSYLLFYAMMTLGVFAFLAEVEAAGGRTQSLDDIGGMFYKRPAASIAALVCLISLIGLPLTAGFWAKFQVMSAAIGVGRTELLIGVVIMAFNAVIAAGYYWKILAKLFDKSSNLSPMPVWRPTLFLAYSICAALTIIWFFVGSGM